MKKILVLDLGELADDEAFVLQQHVSIADALANFVIPEGSEESGAIMWSAEDVSGVSHEYAIAWIPFSVMDRDPRRNAYDVMNSVPYVTVFVDNIPDFDKVQDESSHCDESSDFLPGDHSLASDDSQVLGCSTSLHAEQSAGGLFPPHPGSNKTGFSIRRDSSLGLPVSRFNGRKPDAEG